VNLLAHARRTVSQMTLPDDLVPEKASDAYAINQVVAERLGWEPLAGRLPARRMPRAASCNWTDRSMAGRSAALPAELLDPIRAGQHVRAVRRGGDDRDRDRPVTRLRTGTSA
jgi:hypothetical protein